MKAADVWHNDGSTTEETVQAMSMRLSVRQSWPELSKALDDEMPSFVSQRDEDEHKMRIVLNVNAMITCIASLLVGFCLGLGVTLTIVSPALIK